MFRSTRLLTSLNRKHAINITDNAWGKIKAIFKSKENNGLLFSASSGGCNGFNYNLKILDDDTYNEITSSKIKSTILEKDSSKVYVDPFSEIYLLGTTIDYIKEDYENGIFENKFTFTPDKELASSCGCGISFSPKM